MKTYIIYAYYTTAVPPFVPGAVSKVRFEVGIVQSTNALLATKSWKARMKFGNNKVHHASRRLRAIRPLMGASPQAVKLICTFDFRQKHLNSSYSIFGPTVKVCQSSSRLYV